VDALRNIRESVRQLRSVSITGNNSSSNNNNNSRSVEEACKVAQQVKVFLEAKEGSSLRAWIKHFDADHDEHVTYTEFARGMRALNFFNLDAGQQAQTISDVFNSLDTDRSGELSLEEIDPEQAIMWRTFRGWAAERFESARDIIRVIGGRDAVLTEAITLEQWLTGLARAGWDGKHEEILFSTLNTSSKDSIQAENFKWLDIDLRRVRRKAMARERAIREGRTKPTSKAYRRQLLEDFKQYLKRRWSGNYLRAWRCGLSPSDNMVLQKNQFLKACADIGWHKDVKILWKAFDKDDNGDISLEELDLRTAASLASFQDWLQQNFLNAREAFIAIDKTRTKKIREQEFCTSLKAMGFSTNLHQLFVGLDRDGKKWLILEDVVFLDRWKPPAYLLAKPNNKAMVDLKAALLQRYKTYLRAWRRVLDIDGSNRCNWNEFKAAAEKIGFTGDVAGAWRSFDNDLSGYISLRELDPISSHILTEFKQWAEQEFGSVRSAFDVFDNDGSKSITYQEFRRCCRIYNYEGDTHLLFRAFDIEDMGLVFLKEIEFLDEWDPEEDDNDDEDAPAQAPPASLTQLRRSRLKKGSGPGTHVAISKPGDKAAIHEASLTSLASMEGSHRQPHDEQQQHEFSEMGRSEDIDETFEQEAAAAEIADHEALMFAGPSELLPYIHTKAVIDGKARNMPTLDDLLHSPRMTPAAFRKPRRLVRVPRRGTKAALLIRLPVPSTKTSQQSGSTFQRNATSENRLGPQSSASAARFEELSAYSEEDTFLDLSSVAQSVR